MTDSPRRAATGGAARRGRYAGGVPVPGRGRAGTHRPLAQEQALPRYRARRHTN